MINQRIFSANVGDSSVGIAGPDAIEQDIDNLLANDQELLGTLNDHETQINDLDADVLDINVNIKNFGAIGNGAIDDTQAIQDAIDYTYTNGGGVVLIPQGSYKITAPLIMQNGVSIIGVGSMRDDNAIVSEILNASNGTAIQFPNTKSYTSVRLQNFSIKGDTISGYTPTYAIEGENFKTHCIIENIRIWKHQYGIKLTHCYYSKIQNNYINTAKTAIDLTTANGVKVSNNIVHGIDDVDSYGIYVAGSPIEIEHNFIENCTLKRAIYTSYSNGVLIKSNYLENVNGTGIYIGYSNTVNIMSNYMRSGSSGNIARGILLYNGDNFVIYGNYIEKTTVHTIRADGATNVIAFENYLDESAGATYSVGLAVGTFKARIRTLATSTANRPSDAARGEMFFDTSLGKPIFYDGTNWVDATGTIV